MDLAGEGKVDEAIRRLQIILEERKNLDLAYSNLAAVYKKSGKIAEALAVLREGMAVLPWSYEIFLTYVSYCLAARDYEEVLKIFWGKKPPQAGNDTEIWNSLGVAYAGLGEVEKAIPAYEEALRLDKDYPSAWTNLGTSYLMLFQKTRDETLAEKAVACYHRSLALDPLNAASYNGLGGAYKISGRLDEAISAWEEALRLKPDFDFSLYNLGVAYFEKGDKATALRYLEQYKKLYYSGLQPAEKRKLDELMARCR